MSATIQIGGTSFERVIIGTAWTKDFKVSDLDTDSTGATAKDISGKSITFDVRKATKSSSAILIKTVGSGLTITGSFNIVLATSTQVVRLSISAGDITTNLFGKDGGTFYYSLKIINSGIETVIADGAIVIERVTQPQP